MGKFEGVLLASDFDNTLVDTAGARQSGCAAEVSPGNREALQYFMAEGGRFAVATGRALPAFQQIAPRIPLNAPCVICNGAALYDFEKQCYLETLLLEGALRERCQEVLDRFPGLALEGYHIENVIYAVRPNAYTREHAHVTHVSVTERDSLEELPLPLGKLIFEDAHERLLEVREHLLQESWAGEYEIFFSDKTLLELTAKGASKGNMVLRLAQRLGVSREHIYCAGDEANDLSMLTLAREGFAPANAAAAVRESGATPVPAAKDDALAAFVEILDKRYA